MNKDSFILTLVVLAMILALAIWAGSAVKKLSNRLSDPLGRIEQTAKR